MTSEVPHSTHADSLIEFALLLGQQNDFQEVVRLVTSRASSMFGADIASIVVVNPSTHETIKTILKEGDQSDDKRVHLIQTNVSGWASSHGKPFLSPDIRSDSRFRQSVFAGTDVQSAMCVLLHAGGGLLGFLHVMNRVNAPVFTEDDLALLVKLSGISAPFLCNAQRIQEYFYSPLPERSLRARYESLGLVGQSPEFLGLLRSVDAASRCEVRVLLEGQTGTGKELIARAIHRTSCRAGRPFVAVDCGAIPETLMESELFGHVKGAFTGATQSRKGLIEEADGGTLFVDEVSNLHLDMQAKFLRLLQEGEVRAVGSDHTRRVDVRVIAASSVPLHKLVAEKKFREDLFYRLHVYPLRVPSLSDRRKDIPLLAEHFLRVFAERYGKKVEGFHPSLLHFMYERKWTGNIRELEHFVERLVALIPRDHSVLGEGILPEEFRKEFKVLTLLPDSSAPPVRSLDDTLAEYESGVIRQALIRNRWNQTQAARELQISERTMRYKLERLGISRPE